MSLGTSDTNRLLRHNRLSPWKGRARFLANWLWEISLFALHPKVVDARKAAVGVKFQHPSILVVISPLISLMEDQAAHFSTTIRQRASISVKALFCVLE